MSDQVAAALLRLLALRPAQQAAHAARLAGVVGGRVTRTLGGAATGPALATPAPRASAAIVQLPMRAPAWMARVAPSQIERRLVAFPAVTRRLLADGAATPGERYLVQAFVAGFVPLPRLLPAHRIPAQPQELTRLSVARLAGLLARLGAVQWVHALGAAQDLRALVRRCPHTAEAWRWASGNWASLPAASWGQRRATVRRCETAGQGSALSLRLLGAAALAAHLQGAARRGLLQLVEADEVAPMQLALGREITPLEAPSWIAVQRACVADLA